jgi:hypothetical protein
MKLFIRVCNCILYLLRIAIRCFHGSSYVLFLGSIHVKALTFTNCTSYIIITPLHIYNTMYNTTIQQYYNVHVFRVRVLALVYVCMSLHSPCCSIRSIL